VTPLCQHYRLEKLTLADGKTILWGKTLLAVFMPISLDQALIFRQNGSGIFFDDVAERREVTEIRYTLTCWNNDGTLVQRLRHPVKDFCVYRGNVLMAKQGKPLFELCPLVDIFRTKRIDFGGAKGVQFVC